VALHTTTPPFAVGDKVEHTSTRSGVKKLVVGRVKNFFVNGDVLVAVGGRTVRVRPAHVRPFIDSDERRRARSRMASSEYRRSLQLFVLMHAASLDVRDSPFSSWPLVSYRGPRPVF